MARQVETGGLAGKWASRENDGKVRDGRRRTADGRSLNLRLRDYRDSRRPSSATRSANQEANERLGTVHHGAAVFLWTRPGFFIRKKRTHKHGLTHGRRGLSNPASAPGLRRPGFPGLSLPQHGKS